MRTLVLAALAAGAALAATAPADAAQGCGRGGHRGSYGHCRPNGPPAYVADRYYGGRGYWDGHRFWQHRDRWHGGWRYR